MKHLDLYARRDPQLAPYLLREVDIEYKRQCRKVTFCVWTGIVTVLLAYQYRLQVEELFYLKQYAEYCRAEQDARDDDGALRRKIFVGISNVVKDAFQRDQRWTPEDTERCVAVMERK